MREAEYILRIGCRGCLWLAERCELVILHHTSSCRQVELPLRMTHVFDLTSDVTGQLMYIQMYMLVQTVTLNSVCCDYLLH